MICEHILFKILVKSKYWDDLCRENEILAYMVTCLINMKVEIVP